MMILRNLGSSARAGILGVSLLATGAMGLGCELVVDFDRERIGDGGADGGMGDATTDMVRDGRADEGVGDTGPDMPPKMCTDPGECDDSVACTTDDCADLVCINSPDDDVCDDGNACTTNTCDPRADCMTVSACSLAVGASIPVDDLRTLIVIGSVTAGADGFVAVFAEDGMEVLGFTAVSPGITADVVIELPRPAVDGETVIVRLYEDVAPLNAFDPAMDSVANDGADVEATATLAVAEGLPDVEVRVSGDGEDYTFLEARPTLFAASLTGADPDITLFRELRYRVINDTPAAHPFELVTLTTPPPASPDEVQLAQGDTVAPLEGTASIHWVENDPAVEFTVSPELEVVNAYRCGIHTAAMRGSITFADL